MTAGGSGDLQRRVRSYLKSQARTSLRLIEVEAHRGVITLRGEVGSYYEKQLTWHAAARVAGVRRLIDEVLVRSERPQLLL